MSLNRLQHLAAFCVALLLAACASPQTRIDDNQSAFSKLPVEQQELIKQGKVGIGFDETAVKLALGEPDRVSERTDSNGNSTIWKYVEYETTGGVALYSGFYHYAYAPFYYPFYTDYDSRRERERLRVVFTDGKVTAIERQLK